MTEGRLARNRSSFNMSYIYEHPRPAVTTGAYVLRDRAERILAKRAIPLVSS